MPITPVTGANALPIGVGKTQEEKAALGFERQLLVQLTEQLAKNAMGDEENASAATNAYRDMLPGALADAMVAAGGVGLAANIVAATKGQAK
jgi:Rod binding domain-containing protein